MRLIIDNLSKTYGELTVFSGLNLSFDGPGIYCLMAPSGTGKTTLFRLIMGLEQPDGGNIYFSKDESDAGLGDSGIEDSGIGDSGIGDSGIEDSGLGHAGSGYAGLGYTDSRYSVPGHSCFPRLSAVFQEERLFGHLTPVENLRLVLGKTYSRDALAKELLNLLPSESLKRPVATMSGGMKRRLAFLRAMLAPSDIVILDEPFTGLDERTKTLVFDYLLSHQAGRLFLIATHNRDDVKKLGAALTVLP